MRNIKAGPISDLHLELEPFGDNYFLTKKGSLLGAIRIVGRDPDGLGPDDFLALSMIARTIYQTVDENITITQYYSHFDNPTIALRDRDNPVSRLLSQRRIKFLAQKHLSGSNIVHFFEIIPNGDVNKLNIITAVKHLFLAIRSKESRTVIKNSLSATKTVLCFLDELERMEQELDTTIRDVSAKWGSVMNCTKLSLSEMWSFERYLANLNPSLLASALREPVPNHRLDGLLSDGTREPKNVDGMDVFKFTDEVNIYARILSIVRFGSKNVTPGIWAHSIGSPVRMKHNFVLMIRAKPISKFRLEMMFTGKANELERQQMSLIDMIKGDENKSAAEKKASMKAAVREKLEELEGAELVDDRWWNCHAMAVVYDNDPKRLKRISQDMKRSLDKSGLTSVWETVDLPDAWRTFQPAGGEFSIRDIEFTTSQLGGASLLYRAAEGQITVNDLQGEEAQYIFQSDDGTPFYFSPWSGGRCVLFGIGPIRSGKSFTKNTLACHFMKYGGLFRGIDIDQGCEPVAEAFGDDGGIFRVEEGRTQGFNSFIMARGIDDLFFVSHLKNQILQMLQSNDSPELRSLELYEQRQLDEAIVATLGLPKNLRRLSTVISHCNKELQQKMTRWCNGGMYGHLFDQETDAMGAIDQKVVAFNLGGVKEDPVALPLVMTEIFTRIIRTFEDPRYQTVQKYLDIDEAHILLKIPYALDALVRAVRTWGKKNAGLGLWTQSPQEFYAIPDWPALRSAGSTFFFMSDPQMDRELYQKTFNFLTVGECEAIRNLIPKKEAYIVQPELGVSKKLILEVEPEQYIISTSSPLETDLRRRNRALYGVEKGYLQTAVDLGLIEEARKGESLCVNS